MMTVFRKELNDCLKNGECFLFLGVVMLGFGFGAIWYTLLNAHASVGMAIQFACYALVAAVSFASMNAFAADKKRHTDRLLFSLPIANWKLALGKYLAKLIPLCVAVLLMFLCVLAMRTLGVISMALSLGELSFFLCVGAMMLAVGLFLASVSHGALDAFLSNGVFFLVCFFSRNISALLTASGATSQTALLLAVALTVLLVYLFSRNMTFALAAAILALACIFLAQSFGADNAAAWVATRLLACLSPFDELAGFEMGKLDLSVLFRYLVVAGAFVALTARAIDLRKMGLGGANR